MDPSPCWRPSMLTWTLQRHSMASPTATPVMCADILTSWTVRITHVLSMAASEFQHKFLTMRRCYRAAFVSKFWLCVSKKQSCIWRAALGTCICFVELVCVLCSLRRSKCRCKCMWAIRTNSSQKRCALTPPPSILHEAASAL